MAFAPYLETKTLGSKHLAKAELVEAVATGKSIEVVRLVCTFIHATHELAKRTFMLINCQRFFVAVKHGIGG